MAKYIQVTTTAGNREDADKIAKVVVEKRLAACAQVFGPIRSVYWWKGKRESADEWLCVIKSRSDKYGELESAILSVHPYENPEIIASPIVAGSKKYLAWLNEELDDEVI